MFGNDRSEQLKEVLSGYRNKRASVERDIKFRTEWIAKDKVEVEVLNILIAQVENLINQQEKQTDEHKPDIS